MITFKYVTMKNFLSVGNSPIKIELDSHNLTLIVGRNGAGKSAVPEAVVFGLYGKPFRPFNKPQLVNSINQKQCLVEVEFTAGSKTYKVCRGIKPAVFEIYEDGKLINQDPNIRDYQKVLEQQILKINYRAFTQVVIIGSSAYTPFMRLKTAERREFIEDLLDIRVFSAMNGLAKEKSKELAKAAVEATSNIKNLREKIELQERHIKSRKKEKASTVTSLRESINNLFSENDVHIKDVARLLVEISVLDEEAKPYEDSTERLSEIRRLHKGVVAKIEEQNKEKQFYSDITCCPVCHQDVSDDHRTSFVDSADTRLSDLERNLVELQTQLNAVNEEMEKYEQIMLKVNSLNSDLGRCNKLISVNRAIARSNEELILSMETDTRAVDEEMKMLKEYAKEIIQHTHEKKKIVEEQEYYAAILSFLQDNGIKAKIVKQYIPIINKLINKYLDSLDLFVGFTLDENFNEVIKSRHRDTFSYESFSDGQKRRIDAALLMTWRDVAKSKNSVHTNIAFLDELDSPMDGAGADMLMDLYRASNIKNVFIISHKENVASQADNVIEFEIQNNFTVVKE